MRLYWLKINALAALLLPVCALAQVSYLRPFTDSAGVPSGPTVNSVSTYTGVYALGSPTNLAGQATSASSAGTMVVGGVASDMGWYATGRQTQAFVDYSLGYNGNAQFSQLDGFDQVLMFGLQTKPSPRWTLVLNGQGESTTYGGFLYEPSSSLSLVQQVGTVEELGGAVAGIEAGFQKAEIERSAYQVTQQTEAGDRIVVGVNRFHVDSEEHYQPLHMDPAIENEQAQRLALLRASRDKAAHRIALDDLKQAATGDRNLLYPMREALRARATVGEVCDAFREVYGVYKPPDAF